MPLEDAFKELETYSKELANLKNVKHVIIHNREEFLNKWARVNQYYKYIISNTEVLSDEWFKALNIVTDISDSNPDLKEWIDMIIDRPGRKKQQSDNMDNIHTNEITGPIESLINDVKNLYSFDQSDLESLTWELNKYQRLLIQNQNLFEPGVCQGYLEDIERALNSINERYSYINSDTNSRATRS